jgi:biopolymer transport protein ExbB/TolQ
LLFITENFFFSMGIFSIGLLFYTTGTEIVRIVVSLMTAFFSTKHLTQDAALIGETARLLKDSLVTVRDFVDGEDDDESSAMADKDTLVLPRNALTEDLREALLSGQQDRPEYVAHRYYFDCHELYEFSRLNLQFASEAMPYIGLIGTVLGLIMMFDGLGASVNVEALTPQLAIALKTTLWGAFFGAAYKILAARFDQRLQKLEYDYDDLLRSLDLIAKNNLKMEVQS